MIQALVNWFKKLFSPRPALREVPLQAPLAVERETSALEQTLEQFFQHAPWENKIPEVIPEPTPEPSSTAVVTSGTRSVLGQHMGSFFTQVQWQSARAEQAVPLAIAEQILNQNMQHFFQGSNWQGGLTPPTITLPATERPVTVPAETVANDSTEDFFDDINW